MAIRSNLRCCVPLRSLDNPLDIQPANGRVAGGLGPEDGKSTPVGARAGCQRRSGPPRHGTPLGRLTRCAWSTHLGMTRSPRQAHARNPAVANSTTRREWRLPATPLQRRLHGPDRMGATPPNRTPTRTRGTNDVSGQRRRLRHTRTPEVSETAALDKRCPGGQRGHIASGAHTEAQAQACARNNDTGQPGQQPTKSP